MTELDVEIAVLIPCRDEESTIASVVNGFQMALPGSSVYVYDNASTDDTVSEALKAGAKLGSEPTPGKGRVVRRMFAEIEADVYVMVDGDGTYDPVDAPLLVKELLDNSLDMVVGVREGITRDAGRRGHAVGNKVFNRLYAALFGAGYSDILSGYRVFSRRMIKSFPSVSTGFEIETEISVHASQLNLPVAESTVSYGFRPEGSESKLHTFKDGFKLLRAMIALVKENRPFFMFGSLSFLSLIGAAGLVVPVAITYAQTGLVPRLPTAVLSAALGILGLLFLVSGLILDSIAKSRIEMKRIAYLQTSSFR